MVVILEEVKETILDLSQRTAIVFQTCFIIVIFKL